jgi:hypothetical protein
MRRYSLLDIHHATTFCVTYVHMPFLHASVQLSPGTRRILASKQSLSASVGSGSPTSKTATRLGLSSCSPKSPQQRSSQDFLGRLQQESQAHSGSSGGSAGPASRRGAGSNGGSSGGSMPEECTFRPCITPKAAAKKGRSVEELSEGDRLRREVRLVSTPGTCYGVIRVSSSPFAIHACDG